MEPLESSTESTLEELCAVKIVTHMAFNCMGAQKSRGEYGNDYTGLKISMNQLGVSRRLKDVLCRLVYPIVSAQRFWCSRNSIHPKCVIPVHTWRGELDVLKTAERVVEDERIPLKVRFCLACKYCFDSHIPKLLKGLQRKDIDAMQGCQLYSDSLSHCWEKYVARHAASESDKSLLQFLGQAKHKYYAECYLLMVNEAVFKYLELLPLKTQRLLICRNVTAVEDDNFSPTYYRLMFAKLSETQQEKFIPLFSYNLLMVHLHWPYSSRFVEVAKSLVGNLNSGCYGLVLRHAVMNIVKKRTEDVNHLHLFWKLGMDRGNEFFRDPDPVDRSLIHLVITVLAYYGLIAQGNSANRIDRSIESIKTAAKHYFKLNNPQVEIRVS